MQKYNPNTSFPVENQIWNTPKAENLFSPSDYSFGSAAARQNPSSALDTPGSGSVPGSGASIFKSAASKLLSPNPC